MGIVLSALAVLTNVVFPNNGPDDERLIAAIYLMLFFLFGVSGFCASDDSKQLQNGALRGALTALISMTIQTGQRSRKWRQTRNAMAVVEFQMDERRALRQVRCQVLFRVEVSSFASFSEKGYWCHAQHEKSK